MNFIRLLYYLNIDRDKILVSIPTKVKFSPYCEWLLKFDFKDYDYSNFNPSWLLLNNYSTFLDKFKQESRIKRALEEKLRNDYCSDLGNIYLKYFLLKQ